MEFIDRHVPKKGGGPTVGTYLLVAAINRCVAPCSKASIAEWSSGTALRRLMDVEARQLTSQRFWDTMDRVSSDTIVAIERDLVAHMVREFDLDLQRVLFDATNFFTFIDTFEYEYDAAGRLEVKRSFIEVAGATRTFEMVFDYGDIDQEKGDISVFADSFESGTTALWTETCPSSGETPGGWTRLPPAGVQRGTQTQPPGRHNESSGRTRVTRDQRPRGLSPGRSGGRITPAAHAGPVRLHIQRSRRPHRGELAVRNAGDRDLRR